MKKTKSNRKAQVTTFIIIGILLVAIVWGAIALNNFFQGREVESQRQIELQLTDRSNQIKDTIDACIEFTTDTTLKELGEKGLYLDIPEGGYEYEENKAYWLKDTINIMPDSFIQITDAIKQRLDRDLPNCVDFSEFTQEGWQITAFSPTSTVQIFEQDIGIDVEYTIVATNEDFSRELKNSFYIPDVRFKDMYNKSVDFMNTQLLRQDFNTNDPLEGYDTGDYIFEATKIDNTHIEFSIVDPESKLIDGGPFEIKFIGSFDTNSLPRIYAAGSQILYSPDRLATLVFGGGSPRTITMGQTNVGSVTRRNMPVGKRGTTVKGVTDHVFPLSGPLYLFEPTGAVFQPPVPLIINLNGDQRGTPADSTFIWNGPDGWQAWPHDVSGGNIVTLIPGFSGGGSSKAGKDETIFAEAKLKPGILGAIFAGTIGDIIGWAILIVGIVWGGGLGGVIKKGLFTAGKQVTFAAIKETVVAGVKQFITKGALTKVLIVGAGYYGLSLDEEIENTQDITGTKDGEISIAMKKDDTGKEHCQIIELSNQKRTKLSNGQVFPVEAGTRYSLTAVIKECKWGKTSCKLKCSATGPITTSKFPEVKDEEPPPPPPVAPVTVPDVTGLTLICCLTKDGYCLDNYIGGLCDGDQLQQSCIEIPACTGEPPLTGVGNFNFLDSDGNAIFYAREGDTLSLTYGPVQGASETTIVTAIIKKDGQELKRIILEDGDEDGVYDLEWNIASILSGENRAIITWDIEVNFDNLRTVAFKDVGSLLLIGNQDCAPVGPWDVESKIDIEITSVNYQDPDKFNQDALSTAGIIGLSEPFASFEPGINFYQINNPTQIQSTDDLRLYTFDQCNYHPETTFKLIIVLDENAKTCEQDVNIVRLNPYFILDAEKVENSNVNNIIDNFCDNIIDLNTLNPPQPIILTQNQTITPGVFIIQFQILDEEYPVDYQLRFASPIVIVEGQINDSDVHNATMTLVDGTYLFDLRVEDQEGNVEFSNILKIIVDSTLSLDLSKPPSIKQITLSSGQSRQLNLNNYLEDPLLTDIVWRHTPALPNCVILDPVSISSDGIVTLTHTGIENCEETIIFTATDEAEGRVGSDTIRITTSQ